ncbi:MAG TPA: hypothetical protein VKG85_12405 [Actinomycetes bacterium]|nr:hypothetical protein [Actinomycetes bacterium]
MVPTHDEVVYASQITRDVPASMFSAPRARGMSLLLAPVAFFTPSFFPIRVYLMLLAGALMYVAFRPWVKVFDRADGRYAYVPALAAGCFATLWFTVLYGSLGYPNLWLTFALVAGAGYFYRVATEPELTWRPVAGLAAAFAAAALIRPTDALAVAAPLLLAPLVVRGWRRVPSITSALAGLAIGWGAWIAEAYARFDGPLQRLREGGEINHAGLVFTLPEHIDALDGPALLCIPHKLCAGVEPVATLWWLAMPVLVAVGLLAVARRSGWLPIGVVLAASAVAVATPYIVLIDYAAARFLLPSYGLLSIPAAAGILWLVGWRTQWLRTVAITLVAAAFLGHIVIQQSILSEANDRLLSTQREIGAQAEFLRTEVGIQPPCVFWGGLQSPYLLGCRSRWLRNELPRADDPDMIAALDRGEVIVVRLGARTKPPAFMADWQRIALPQTDRAVVYIHRPGP